MAAFRKELAAGAKGVGRPAGSSIQNDLGLLLISQDFLPRVAPLGISTTH
jgi:hypothetical protein